MNYVRNGEYVYPPEMVNITTLFHSLQVKLVPSSQIPFTLSSEAKDWKNNNEKLQKQ